MTDTTIVRDGPVAVRIEGLNRTRRALERAGADMGEMRDLMHRVGMVVVEAADAPVLSGALAATLRAGRGKTKAVVRAGGARTPYAGVIHYGWPERGIPPHPFLVDAIRQERGEIFDTLDDGIAEILRRRDLT